MDEDIEMHVLGVGGIRAGAENGGEPAARGGAHRRDRRLAACIAIRLDRQCLAVGKLEGRDVDRKAKRVGAQVAVGGAIAVAAFALRQNPVTARERIFRDSRRQLSEHIIILYILTIANVNNL